MYMKIIAIGIIILIERVSVFRIRIAIAILVWYN